MKKNEANQGLELTEENIDFLLKIINSRKEEKRKIDRANIILLYYSGQTISGIAREYKTNRPKIERTIKKQKQWESKAH